MNQHKIYYFFILLFLFSCTYSCREKQRQVKDNSVVLTDSSQVRKPQSAIENKDDAYSKKREEMVRYQIEERGITDSKTLSAMRKVKRHLFVPEAVRGSAYADHPLPIGEGQTISQPYIVAFMTSALELKGNEKVLEIGTGSGYQAAILAEIVDSVFTIEIICSLAERAEKLLKELDYKNIVVKCGDGYKGWIEHSPFDAIIVTCAPDDIPQPLIDQLKDGGKMIIPVGDSFPQSLVLVTKKGNKIEKKDLLPVAFVPMTGEAQKKKNAD